ncbi:MAG: dihydropteroate synthase [Caulobacterales bacterium]
MGILNVTPDSFSDGGKNLDPGAACARALQMLADGADSLDIGGESTRPGATPVSAKDEIARVVPVIKAIRAQSQAAISIDTMKPDVARAAFDAGADIWNDVTALRFAPESVQTAKELNAFVVLMHMQGEPQTMQKAPSYPRGVTAEVLEFFAARMFAAQEAGIAHDKLIIDPGIGFGKAIEHNLTLLADIERLAELGPPVLIGASRKNFISKIDDGAPVEQRLGGSLAVSLWAASQGARIIRVHDVRETAQALKVWSAIATADQ